MPSNPSAPPAPARPAGVAEAVTVMRAAALALQTGGMDPYNDLSWRLTAAANALAAPAPAPVGRTCAYCGGPMQEHERSGTEDEDTHVSCADADPTLASAPARPAKTCCQDVPGHYDDCPNREHNRPAPHPVRPHMPGGGPAPVQDDGPFRGF